MGYFVKSVKHPLPKTLQPSIVVIPNIYGRDFQPLTNLIDGKAIEEMELYSDSLIRRKAIKRLLQNGLPITQLNKLDTRPRVSHRGRRLGIRAIPGVVERSTS